jgi:hypothetical protein
VIKFHVVPRWNERARSQKGIDPQMGLYRGRKAVVGGGLGYIKRMGKEFCDIFMTIKTGAERGTEKDRGIRHKKTLSAVIRVQGFQIKRITSSQRARRKQRFQL